MSRALQALATGLDLTDAGPQQADLDTTRIIRQKERPGSTEFMCPGIYGHADHGLRPVQWPSRTTWR
jgi:hypothetical protein